MDAIYQKGYIFIMKIMKSMRRLFAPILLLLFAALFMPVMGQTDAPTASENLTCGPPHQVPREAYSLLEEGEALAGQEKWDEAIIAYDKAIQIDQQFDLAWKAKADLLQMLGLSIEAEQAYDKIEEIKEAHTTSILDHSMATSVDETTRNVTSRTLEFSVNDSRACSWLSLKNVRAGPLCGAVLWNWYSPAGDLLHTDSVNIPPINGDYWSTYNVWSTLDIAGHPAANLSGDWHVDVFSNGQKILTEYFLISGDMPPSAPEDPEDQQLYHPSQSEETSYQETYNLLYNQGKKDEAINKGDRLLSEGRYDESSTSMTRPSIKIQTIGIIGRYSTAKAMPSLNRESTKKLSRLTTKPLS
jgi:tetratricopeptide (TPR) repeat protein